MSELRKLAEAAKEWSNVTEIRSDTGDYGCTIGVMVDGEFYPVVTVECESYYADSMPLAAYIAAANPAAVIGLLDEIERLTAERDALARCKLADQDAYVAMRDQRDAAQADAKRYQWLRSRVPGKAYRIMGVICSEGGAAVDESIDKAMGEQS